MLLGAVSLAVLGSAPGAAGASPDPASLAHGIAAPYPGLQREDGSFYDYVHPGRSGRYSEAMLGLALLQTGQRENDKRLIRAAFRAFRFTLLHPEWQREYESVFENYAMAAAYNLVRDDLVGPRFAWMRRAWTGWLKRVQPCYIAVRRRAYFNKHLIEAAAWLELASSGLRSRVPGAVLNHPGRAAARAADYVNRVLPRLTGRFRGRVGRRPARLLADPQPSPLAYDALSLGFFARALRTLGPAARPRARRTLLEAARASLALTAPNGDLAYAGRSQEQAWALSMTAYGAETAAGVARRSERPGLQELAARARRRLEGLYPVGRYGMALTPAIGTFQRGDRLSLDKYADGPAYAGLTLLALEWSAGRPTAPAYPARHARRGRAALPLPGGGGLAVVHTGGVWFAVRGAGDPHGDLRSDFGLVGLAVRRGAGWPTLVGPRPSGSLRDGGAGPVLLRHGHRIPPAGGAVSARGGLVRARAGWAQISYRALKHGVRVSWRARRGDAFEYSVFFRRPPRRLTARTVGDGAVRVTTSRPARSGFRAGYVSGLDPHLWRARLRFRARHRERVSVTIATR